MQRYSGISLIREGLGGHRGWGEAWAKARPKEAYDAVIIGGGGHGLATAYYLAKTHGLTRVAVLERGWIGGGNTGRNTTVCRSNYFFPESVALYDLALRLYEELSRGYCQIKSVWYTFRREFQCWSSSSAWLKPSI